ncbi:MAG: peptidase M61 [Alphaproteobacteria bacterium]|nr:peptidase M61 [Alphaproteobacteria bacterium]
MRSIFLFCASVFALSPLSAFAQSQDGRPELRLELAPRDGNADGIIDRLGVRIFVADAAGGFRLATMANNVDTSASRISDLRFLADGAEAVVQVTDVTEDPSNATRRWRVEGAKAPVTISYDLTIDPDREPLALPQYELRTGAAGMSGAAIAFLILPDDQKAREVEVSWNLDDMPAETVGISSIGIGRARSHRALRSSEIASTYYMAGAPKLFRSDGFFGALQGDLAFDGLDLMQWAKQLHSYYADFFQYKPEIFGVFGRTNALNPGSGIGLTDSFAFTFNDTISREGLQGLLAHEMLHAWVRSLGDTMDSANGLGSSWFGEGLAVHYQRLLPRRAGLIDDAAFLRDLNETAARYYTNKLIGTPNDEIAAGFWRDTRIRVLPYDRGSLYFAKVDADIRAISGGTRSLDDLVRRMLAERRAGRAMDLALWERLLLAELGDEGLNEFREMLGGKTIVPPPDAFGSEFARVRRPLKRFDLGFDPEVLVSESRIVRGLKPGSNAAKAGLRNGDVILNRFPQDSMQADQQAVLKLNVLRDGRSQELTYLPRGEVVYAYQWIDMGSGGGPRGQ